MASKIKGILVFILAMFLLFGCDPTTGEGSANGEGQGTQTPDDGGDTQTPTDPQPQNPSAVSEYNVVTDLNTVTVTWTNPKDADLDYVSLRYAKTEKPTQIIYNYKNYDGPGAECSYTYTGLLNSVSYTFTFIAFDKDGNQSEPVTFEAVPRDWVAPGKVLNVTVKKVEDYYVSSFTIKVSWTNPFDEDLVQVIVEKSVNGGEKSVIGNGAAAPAGSDYAVTSGLWSEEYYFYFTTIDVYGNKSEPQKFGPYIWE